MNQHIIHPMRASILMPLACALLLAVTPAQAGEGHDHDHDHDHDHAPAAAGSSALPRFAAASDAFELVGVLDGRTLSLYLDRADDNTPVQGATLELEVGGTPLAVSPVGEGEFRGALAVEPAGGEIAVTATVLAGDTTARLEATLDVHEEAHAEASHSAVPVKALAGWGGGVLLALMVLVGLKRVRAARAGGAA